MPQLRAASAQSFRRPSGVLLTTADRQIERFTVGADPRRSFEDSFYEAILFHERAVLPDIFAFISSALHEAQLSGETFHLDAAIEAGLVIPTFRGATTSFEESLAAVTGQKIQGTQGTPDFIATRLDEAFAKSANQTFIQWPKDLSRDYGTLVLNILNGIDASAPFTSKAYGQIRAWPLMRRFMQEHAIVEKIKADMDAENGELRRGNFYNILLATLNKLSPSPTLKVDDCYNDLALHAACKDKPEVRAPIRNLLIIANTAYHLNMAKAFEAGNYIPGRLIAPEALPALDLTLSTARAITESEAQAESRPILSHSVEVTIPDVEQLRTAKWEDLIAIRKDLGRGYFAALKNWHKNPSEFEKCLKNYAAALTARVQIVAPPTRVMLNKFSESERDGIVGVAKHALVEVAEMGGGNKLLGLVDIGSNITMSWMYERPLKLSFTHSPNAAIVV